ncbi:MAG: Crp/Fnr family transcriptional regulator [Cytophagales bacterium]|nr:Crp/Fnr family transcriptional regulator [Cytophagales bacterium]
MNDQLSFAALYLHLNKETNLSSEDFEACKGFFEIQNLKKGHLISEPNSLIDSQSFVVKGCVRAYFQEHEWERDYTLLFAIEEWWIGDFMAYHTDSPSTLFVECLEDSSLITISKENLEKLYHKVPALETFFLRKLERAYAANHRRILAMLKDPAEKRYADFLEQFPSIEQRVKNYQIASYLGIAPESLSRIRRQLANS